MERLAGSASAYDERTVGSDAGSRFDDDRFRVQVGEISFGSLSNASDIDYYQLRLPGPGDYLLKLSINPVNAPSGAAPWSSEGAGLKMRIAQPNEPTKSTKPFFFSEHFQVAWGQADAFYIFHYDDAATTDAFAVKLDWLAGSNVQYALTLTQVSNFPLGYIYVGTDKADTILGTDRDDSISGGAGDDNLVGMKGNDGIEGGPGIDTVYYSGASSAVWVQLPHTPYFDLPQFKNYGFAAGGDDTDTLSGIENVAGTSYNDFIEGNDQDNLLLGDAGDDYINGSDGNNTLVGMAGNDTLIGYWGLDHASYNGPRAQFKVSPSKVTDLKGLEGEDTLQGIERLDFDDMSIALDVEQFNSGGKTAQILRGLFGDVGLKNAVYAGLGIRLFDADASYADVVALAINTDAFQQLAGSRANADFVKLVYKNVVGTAPSASALADLVGQLDAGVYTQVSLGVVACEHYVNLQGLSLMGLQTSGLDFIPAEG